MSDRQSQSAGENARQIQVAGDFIVHTGITEQRAAEIAEARARAVIDEYTAEAGPLVEARIAAFDARLVAHLASNGLLDALRDPAFQVLLRKAQLGAASTDRQTDYAMLAQLLGERALQDDRRHRADIERAVQVVDQLDDEALQGLTIAWCVLQFTPRSGLVGHGLDALENVFTQFASFSLPEGHAWLEHLDTLDAVRLTGFGISSMKNLTDYYGAKMAGYVCTGFDEETALAICRKLTAPGQQTPLEIVVHELRPSFKRLAFPNLGEIEAVLRGHGIPSERQERALTIARDDGLIDQVHADALQEFREQIDKRPNLLRVRIWWDAIPMAFHVGGIGRVLARSNALRFDSLNVIPPLS